MGTMTPLYYILKTREAVKYFLSVWLLFVARQIFIFTSARFSAILCAIKHIKVLDTSRLLGNALEARSPGSFAKGKNLA